MQAIIDDDIKNGMLDLSKYSSILDNKVIGDEGARQICTLNTNNIRIMALSKN